VKRSSCVVRANVSHDAKTDRVVTSATPFRTMSRATSSSSSIPCSMESTPASAAARAPARWPEWQAILRATRVDRLGRRAQLRRGERRVGRSARRVEIDLHQIRPEIELRECGVHQARAIGRHPHRRIAGLPDPGAGHEDRRVTRASGQLVPHRERDRAAIGRRRAHIAGPEDPGLHEAAGVPPRDLAQHRRRIVPARDPVAAARHREMAVAVDQPGDDRCAAGVDDLGRAGVDLAIGRDPRDGAVAQEEAHSQAERVALAIGERGAAQEDRGAGHYPPSP